MCSRVVHIRDPHGHSWNNGEKTGDGDTNLDNLETCRRLVVVSQWKLESEETVEVDKDKAVDGGAEQEHFQRGHQVTKQWTKCPPGGRNNQ